MFSSSDWNYNVIAKANTTFGCCSAHPNCLSSYSHHTNHSEHRKTTAQALPLRLSLTRSNCSSDACVNSTSLLLILFKESKHEAEIFSSLCTLLPKERGHSTPVGGRTERTFGCSEIAISCARSDGVLTTPRANDCSLILTS